MTQPEIQLCFTASAELAEAVASAADAHCTSRSAFMRRAIVAQLISDGLISRNAALTPGRARKRSRMIVGTA
jgi:predicted transcriptional regulator